MNFDNDSNQFNSINIKITGIQYLIDTIILSEEFINFNTSDKNKIYTKIDKMFKLTKKDNYEIVYIILLFKEILELKKNRVGLVKYFLNNRLTSDNFIDNIIIILSIVFLVEGKYFDDFGMINSDYISLLDQMDYKISLHQLNNMERKLLILIDYKISLNYLDNFMILSDFLITQ